MTSPIQPIQWQGDALRLLDQRQLPQRVEYVTARTAAEVAAAIADMVVRGAPAIGICAAYGMALAARGGEDAEQADRVLRASRPTAVNLHWALDRMAELDAGQVEARVALAEEIHRQDLAMNLAMAAHGVGLLGAGARVLTHCNTGALATGGHGTALGVIRTAHQRGLLGAVYATETRPWLQGARLTAWELQQERIPFVLTADAAAASLMQRGRIDWVVVGADRIAANGDTANKIGTYALACAAKLNGVGFMVVAPSSTIDLACPEGGAIPVESRDGEELTRIAGQRIAPEGVVAENPVFDVTPAALITAIVTEHGVARGPSPASVLTVAQAGAPSN